MASDVQGHLRASGQQQGTPEHWFGCQQHTALTSTSRQATPTPRTLQHNLEGGIRSLHAGCCLQGKAVSAMLQDETGLVHLTQGQTPTLIRTTEADAHVVCLLARDLDGFLDHLRQHRGLSPAGIGLAVSLILDLCIDRGSMRGRGQQSLMSDIAMFSTQCTKLFIWPWLCCPSRHCQQQVSQVPQSGGVVSFLVNIGATHLSNEDKQHSVHVGSCTPATDPASLTLISLVPVLVSAIFAILLLLTLCLIC